MAQIGALHHVFVKLVVGISLAAWLASCVHRQSSIRINPMPMEQVSAPRGDYAALAWLPADLIVVDYEPDPLGQQAHRLSAFHLGKSDLQTLNLPDDEQHPDGVTFYQHPIALPDGRLGYVRSRITRDSSWHTYVFAWNPKSGDSQLVFPYEISEVGFGAEVALAPDLVRGVMGTTAGIEDKLLWLNQNKASPLSLGMIRANGPAWSPDGRYVVFKGNRTLQGPLGPSWALQPYSLWLMPAGCDGQEKTCAQALRQIDGDIEGGHLRWSPGGEWLVFAGNPRGYSDGVWLLNMHTEALVQVAQGDYATPEWSPDGRRILVTGRAVALNPTDLPTHRQTLYLIDVTKVVEAGAP